MKLADVKVNKLHLGGGFGRRGAAGLHAPGRADCQTGARASRQADLVARRGYAARLLPADHAMQTDRRAGCGRQGDALHARLSGQSILAYLTPSRMENGVDRIAFQSWTKEEFGYGAIPNLLIDHAVRNTHVPVGFWRGVNTNQNAIYMECFIDELAHAAAKDPLEFRRALLTEEPEASCRAECRRGEGWMGYADAKGRVPRRLPELWLWQLHGGGRRGFSVCEG